MTTATDTTPHQKAVLHKEFLGSAVLRRRIPTHHAQSAMAFDYLLKIERAHFPLLIGDPYEVECIHVLRAAELIEAEITAAAEDNSQTAVVRRITPMGRAEIERIKRRA